MMGKCIVLSFEYSMTIFVKTTNNKNKESANVPNTDISDNQTKIRPVNTRL